MFPPPGEKVPSLVTACSRISSSPSTRLSSVRSISNVRESSGSEPDGKVSVVVFTVKPSEAASEKEMIYVCS